MLRNEKRYRIDIYLHIVKAENNVLMLWLKYSNMPNSRGLVIAIIRLIINLLKKINLE